VGFRALRTAEWPSSAGRCLCSPKGYRTSECFGGRLADHCRDASDVGAVSPACSKIIQVCELDAVNQKAELLVLNAVAVDDLRGGRLAGSRVVEAGNGASVAVAQVPSHDGHDVKGYVTRSEPSFATTFSGPYGMLLSPGASTT
jgi:hypothetical protein